MKILQNEITETQTSFSINFDGKLSFILSFLFAQRLHCCYRYFDRSYVYNRYNYSRPCALNAEFQHFILRFNKISLLCRDRWKRGYGGETRPKERVTLWITLMCMTLEAEDARRFWMAAHVTSLQMTNAYHQPCIRTGHMSFSYLHAIVSFSTEHKHTSLKFCTCQNCIHHHLHIFSSLP
jgi:hypothetical protein